MPKFHAQHLLSAPNEHLLEPPHPDPSYDYDDLYLNPVKTLISWRAASRPYRKKDRSYYITIAILIILVSAIAILAGEKLLIGALFALGFLVYVLNFVPPQDIEYKVSTQGITVGDHFYHWQELDSFWFSDKEGHRLLNVLTKFRFPGLLMLVLGETPEEQLKMVTARYLPFHEIAPKTTFEKWSDSLQKYFPLENPKKEEPKPTGSV